MTPLRRREHARRVAVTVRHAGHVSCQHERCEFVGGRDDPADGGPSRLFAGDDNAVSAPEPPWPVDLTVVEESLRELVARLGGDAVLEYQVVATGRAVETGHGGVHQRLVTVWALTGHALTPTGRVLPVGASGRGTGLDVVGSVQFADRIVRTRRALATAEGPLRGEPPVVLSPQAAAVMVHEAVGHYAEAMHVGAPAVHRLSTRIASECLSVQDEPGPDNGSRRYDDEAVVSLGPTEVVHNGVLVAQLHNRATARAAACAPTGHGRAAQVWDPPLPRMSSLVCASGHRTEEALLERLGSGVYIHRLADGYRQGKTVAAHVVLGEHVERGRRTGRYFTGSHVAERLNLLTKVSELGNGVERNANGMCGKDGQLLFDVFTSAPAMRLAGLRPRS